ncbi:MAG: hypothetical protein ABI647_26280, partial [Gemmatimonadota bacterium]
EGGAAGMVAPRNRGEQATDHLGQRRVGVSGRMLDGFCSAKTPARWPCRQVGIQIFACERHPRLHSGRLESPEIPKPRRTTPSADQAIMEHNDFTEREVPHLRKTLVQLAVLRQHATRSVLEIGGGLGDEIANGGCSQLVDGNVETLRGFTELALGVVG